MNRGSAKHKVSKNLEVRDQWSRKWPKHSLTRQNHSAVCRLQFTTLGHLLYWHRKLGLPSKNQSFKEMATPKSKVVQTRSWLMELADGSIHYSTFEATAGSSTTKTRPEVINQAQYVYGQYAIQHNSSALCATHIRAGFPCTAIYV